MARQYASFVRKIEVEVETLEQVKEAVEAGADIIMLDNMSDEDMRKAVTLIAGRAKTECSGNVTRENIARLRDIGIDYVSSGALTHSAPILDLSMKHLRPWQRRRPDMTTAERRAAILQQLAHAGAPLAARTLATHYGVSRQVIVQDLAVIRASHPGIISTARGYVLEQPDQPAGCTREFKVRHTPDQTGQELNLIVDCGGRVKNISISHRVYGRITAEMDIRSRQDVREFLQSFEDSSSTVLSTATDGYHYHLVEAATPDRLSLIEKELKEHGFLAPLQPWEH